MYFELPVAAIDEQWAPHSSYWAITSEKLITSIHIGGANGEAISESTFVMDNLTIGAVPIPSAVWLFGSGLLGLVGAARRKERI